MPLGLIFSAAQSHWPSGDGSVRDGGDMGGSLKWPWTGPASSDSEEKLLQLLRDFSEYGGSGRASALPHALPRGSMQRLSSQFPKDLMSMEQS